MIEFDLLTEDMRELRRRVNIALHTMSPAVLPSTSPKRISEKLIPCPDCGNQIGVRISARGRVRAAGMKYVETVVLDCFRAGRPPMKPPYSNEKLFQRQSNVRTAIASYQLKLRTYLGHPLMRHAAIAIMSFAYREPTAA